MITLILAGGSGTRLWPLSREEFPKQYLNIASPLETMLQQTIARVRKTKTTMVVCNDKHRFLAAEQMRKIGQECTILLEPMAKNTAPAVALAALHAVQNGAGSESMLVLPADHLIDDEELFNDAIDVACHVAQQGRLVTFGVKPSRPETGYGYIKVGEALSTDHRACNVERFIEKPESEIAKQFLDDGGYLWNSGMFMFTPDTYLSELSKLDPEIYQACTDTFDSVHNDLDFTRFKESSFKNCPNKSIDYAVMEKAQTVVVPFHSGWSDIGSWESLWEKSERDVKGNHFSGDVISEKTSNTLVKGGDRLVATLGVEDLVIIDTKDALLVAKKELSQDVKKIVDELKLQKRTEATLHKKAYRPWGCYESIDSGNRFQVKRITVEPGAKLSVQMHYHRAEHWVVVSGTAKVGVNEEEKILIENESVYIPLGAIHYLENPGKVPLELIEVQVGSYLGEDDIVRFEDKYGRA